MKNEEPNWSQEGQRDDKERQRLTVKLVKAGIIGSCRHTNRV